MLLVEIPKTPATSSIERVTLLGNSSLSKSKFFTFYGPFSVVEGSAKIAPPYIETEGVDTVSKRLKIFEKTG